MTRCTDLPISWLRLEKLALDELETADARAARDHLEECTACRATLASLESDRRQLRALRLPETAPRRSRLPLALGLTAGAAAALLLLVFARGGSPRNEGGRRAAVKGGGAPVVSLVRERRGIVRADPEAFEDGDRFKVSITCREPGERNFDVVVFQDGAPHRPLGDRVRAYCGNESLLPGAFRVSGDQPFTLCVAPDRPVNLQAGRIAGAACVTVPPAED